MTNPEEQQKQFTAVLDYYSPKNETVVTESGFRYLDTNSVKKGEHTITDITEHDLFIQFYKLNNRLRYCNGSYYKFVDPEMDKKYREWLQSPQYKAISFQLYYGNGVVD